LPCCYSTQHFCYRILIGLLYRCVSQLNFAYF
jgi:hypothetical protein